MAKLLGVLSLQSLPRRLALDFRDLFSEGFAFDFVRGDVAIEDGIAATNNLQMKGVNAAVLMEGRADIERETQDLKVVVVPEINAGTASLATGDQSGHRAGHLPRADVPARAADRGRHAGVPHRRHLGRPACRARRAQAGARDAATRRRPPARAGRDQPAEIPTMKIAAIQMVSGVSRGAQPGQRAAAARWSRRASRRAAGVLPEYFCLMGHKDSDKLAIARLRRRPDPALPGAGRARARPVDVGGTLPLRGRRSPACATRMVFSPAGERRPATTRSTCSGSTTGASATTSRGCFECGADAGGVRGRRTAGASA